jgi:hypothetical protein
MPLENYHATVKLIVVIMLHPTMNWEIVAVTNGTFREFLVGVQQQFIA